MYATDKINNTDTSC